MAYGLARDIGTDFVPKLTAESLTAPDDRIDTVVAGEHGKLLGACRGLRVFSTWRGAGGLGVVDLFVLPDARSRNIPEHLMREAARRRAARGAPFIEFEADQANAGAARCYTRLGFAKKAEDRLDILEHDQFTGFILSGGET